MIEIVCLFVAVNNPEVECIPTHRRKLTNTAADQKNLICLFLFPVDMFEIPDDDDNFWNVCLDLKRTQFIFRCILCFILHTISKSCHKILFMTYNNLSVYWSFMLPSPCINCGFEFLFELRIISHMGKQSIHWKVYCFIRMTTHDIFPAQIVC